MSEPNRSHTYRLISRDADFGNPRVEFEAPSVSQAIGMMETLCGPREVELFENERSLGRLRLVGDSGYWIVSPAA